MKNIAVSPGGTVLALAMETYTKAITIIAEQVIVANVLEPILPLLWQAKNLTLEALPMLKNSTQ
jgi:hypothetical protein